MREIQEEVPSSTRKYSGTPLLQEVPKTKKDDIAVHRKQLDWPFIGVLIETRSELGEAESIFHYYSCAVPRAGETIEIVRKEGRHYSTYDYVVERVVHTPTDYLVADHSGFDVTVWVKGIAVS